jgi:beta-glucosidase
MNKIRVISHLLTILLYLGSAHGEEPAVQVNDLGTNGVAGVGPDAKKVEVSLSRPRNIPGPGTDPGLRVEALLKAMTFEEKCDYIGGQQDRIKAVPRLGLPEILMADGPLGFRRGGTHSTAYPAGVCVAATWNLDCVKAMGESYGKDYRAQGFHIALGPGLNIIRDPRCGRNFEYYSEDPFLTGRMATTAVQAIQSQGVLTTLKHFACNNQETSRNFYSAEIDERSLHEIYLPGFKAAIAEGRTGCIMSAFNQINGVSCTENAHLNNDILRGELGFTGILMSDWSAARSIAVANGGLDLEMATGKYMNPENIQKAITAGTVTMATVDEKVRRILRTIIAAGFLDRDQERKDIPKDNPESAKAALEVARQGFVLLKNQGGLLPLDPATIKTIAVIGHQAHPALCGGGGSSIMSPYHATSIFDGMKARYPGAKLVSASTSIAEAEAGNLGYAGPVKLELFKNKHPGFSKEALAGKPELVREVKAISFTAGDVPQDFPKTFAGRWSARIQIPSDGVYAFVASSDEGVLALLDGKPLIKAWRINGCERPNEGLARLSAGSTHELQVEWFTYSRRPPVLRFAWKRAEAFEKALESARQADAVLLCTGFDYMSEGEGNDRDFTVDPLQQMLLEEIPRVNPKTIVTLFGGAGIDCQGWLDRVPGLLHLWYPGQEGGTALSEIISGAVNPSGKLPLTMPKRIEDHPSYPYYLNPVDMAKNRAVYGEGIFVGYRGYDAKNIEPLFPFGYGLSYTTFAYGDLKIEDDVGGRVKATFKITNTGSRAGAEVAELYVSPPPGDIPRPPKELKGFAKVFLNPGETKAVAIELDQNAFAYWHPEKKAWTLDAGSYGILIGASSRDIRLRDTLTRRKVNL